LTMLVVFVEREIEREREREKEKASCQERWRERGAVYAPRRGAR